MHMKKQQRGGTVVGFILGVIVGLGGALAVAVYVTKVPVPFLNKNGTRAPDQDAAEAKRNKDWDPNAAVRQEPGATGDAGAGSGARSHTGGAHGRGACAARRARQP